MGSGGFPRIGAATLLNSWGLRLVPGDSPTITLRNKGNTLHNRRSVM